MEGKHPPRDPPGAQQLLPDEHISMKVFDSFFKIRVVRPEFPQGLRYRDPPRSILRPVSRTTTPNKRLMMIVNYSTDVSKLFWEFSGHRLSGPIEDSNSGVQARRELHHVRG